jgi:hypothetical protein
LQSQDASLSLSSSPSLTPSSPSSSSSSFQQLSSQSKISTSSHKPRHNAPVSRQLKAFDPRSPREVSLFVSL